jgi:hypothetical protein
MAGHGQDAAGRGLDAAEVPLVEAARLLNTTPEALRKRLQRGKSIRGSKRDSEWYVRLPAAVASRGQDVGSPPSGRVQDAPRDTAGHGQDASTWSLHDEFVDTLQAQVGDLRAMIAEQRVELEARRREVQELIVLLERAQRLALPSGVPNDTPVTNATPAPAPWWAWARWAWRRR